MSVGAIHFDSIGAAASFGGPVVVRSGTEFDFAAMLSIASALNSHADIHGPATKAEVSRTSAVANHLRTTTITFTDGTSETRVDGIEHDPVQAPAPFFVPVPAGPQTRIAELSDLEPQPGLDTRTEPTERWRNAMGKRASAFRALPNSDASQAPVLARRPVDGDDAQIGKLIDALV